MNNRNKCVTDSYKCGTSKITCTNYPNKCPELPTCDEIMETCTIKSTTVWTPNNGQGYGTDYSNGSYPTIMAPIIITLVLLILMFIVIMLFHKKKIRLQQAQQSATMNPDLFSQREIHAPYIIGPPPYETNSNDMVCLDFGEDGPGLLPSAPPTYEEACIKTESSSIVNNRPMQLLPEEHSPPLYCAENQAYVCDVPQYPSSISSGHIAS